MNENNQSLSFFEANFGEYGGKKSWASYQELSGWINDLQSKWAWLNQYSNQNNFAPIWENIGSKFSEISRLLLDADRFHKNNQFDQEKNHISTAKNRLESFINMNPWILPNSVEYNYINELKNAGKIEEACISVAYLLKLSLQNMPLRFVVLALIRWELFEKGSKERVRFETSNLKRLSADLESTLTKYQNAEEIQSTKFLKLFDELNEQKLTQNENFESKLEKEQEKFNLQLASSQTELENLKQTYDKHMALEAPVNYWEKKRIKHRNWVVASTSTFILGMIISGHLLNSQLNTISSSVESSLPMATIQAGKNGTKENTKIEIPTSTVAQTTKSPNSKEEVSSFPGIIQTALSVHLGAFILFATLGFWMLRLIVRVMLSNMHLENDASERVVMAKTYLALIRDDKLSKEDGMNTVLAALFRPSGDGIVKDEGIPPTTLDWFTKIGK